VKEYTFTLILESPRAVTTELEDAVFEAGCDDASITQRSGAVHLEFDRNQTSFFDALLSAIHDVSKIAGARIARVAPDELVSASEIANRIERTRESVRLLVEAERGPGGFPTAVSGSRGGTRLWRWSEVAEWLDAHGIAPGLKEEARVIAAVNGALDLMRNADEKHRRAILNAVRKAS
jgi:hypothetical protein